MKFYKLLFSAAIIIFGSIMPFVLIDDVVAVEPPKKVVYFIPHQDDETLFMGASVAQHVLAGREVYLVLVTDGAASGAITSVNNKLINDKNPATDPLTITQFSAARDKEFIAAAKKLGVNETRIDFRRQPDGGLTQAAAFSIINEYIAKFPGASFKTMSWLDLHKDHYTLGYALNTRCVQDTSIDCRFYQASMYQKDGTLPAALAVPSNTVTTPKSGRYINTNQLIPASAEYMYYNPAEGRYAIGYASVKNLFDYVRTTKYSKYHMNYSNWNSTTDRNAAARWIQTIQKPVL